MTEFSCLVQKRNGRLHVCNQVQWRRALARLPESEDLALTLTTIDRKRTTQQNKYWHAVVIPAFSEYCGYELHEMKDALALELLPKTIIGLDGRKTVIAGHTADLSVAEFNDLIERTQRFAAQFDPPLIIPDPDPAWRSAKADARKAVPA